MNTDIMIIQGEKVENSNLYKKLLNISKEMGRLPKNGRNDFHKYDYVTEADALDKFRELCVKENIFVVPDTTSINKEGDLTTVNVKYTVIDVETGDSVVLNVPGQGQDKGDKGVYKAATGSYKYFILKGFMVPTGDDPERDNNSHRNEKVENEAPAIAPNTYNMSSARFAPSSGFKPAAKTVSSRVEEADKIDEKKPEEVIETSPIVPPTQKTKPRVSFKDSPFMKQFQQDKVNNG